MSKILAWIKANFTQREVQIMDLKTSLPSARSSFLEQNLPG